MSRRTYSDALSSNASRSTCSSCMFGAMIFSQTFCNTSACAKSAWWTEVETVVRKRIDVVTSRSWCGASEVPMRRFHTWPSASLRKGWNSSSYLDMKSARSSTTSACSTEMTSGSVSSSLAARRPFAYLSSRTNPSIHSLRWSSKYSGKSCAQRSKWIETSSVSTCSTSLAISGGCAAAALRSASVAPKSFSSGSCKWSRTSLISLYSVSDLNSCRYRLKMECAICSSARPFL
mmetsp:Transcript_44279/g.103552  ORF Transcript_44279/g.103552 Transcript_44279/m.103552 type:complete len:233 (+) Transcript_44279:1829-2527(+)